MHIISYPLFYIMTGSQRSRKWVCTCRPLPREVWPSPRRSSPCQLPSGHRIRCRHCIAAVLEGEPQQIWLSVLHTVTLPLAHRFPSTWSPTLKPSSSSAPTGGPGRPSDSRIVAIADVRDLSLQRQTNYFTL
jgi:hypothetical protein